MPLLLPCGNAIAHKRSCAYAWATTRPPPWNGCEQNVPRKAAVAAPANLPPDTDDDDVDRASNHRHGPVFRHRDPGLVADRGGLGAECLCGFRILSRLVPRPPDSVRLHLRADPPPARRHPSSDLGCRLWLRTA